MAFQDHLAQAKNAMISELLQSLWTGAWLHGQSRETKESVLLYLGEGKPPFNTFTVDQDMENVAVFGAVGSGKSSGVDANFSIARMRHGYGILTSLPKPGDPATFKKWAAKAGRENDYRALYPDGKSAFNVFDFIAKQAGGNKQAVIRAAVDLVNELGDISGRGRMSDSGGDAKFFVQSASRLSHDSMNVILEADGEIKTGRVLEMIQTIPATLEDAQNKDSFCKQQCVKALERCKPERLPEVRKSVNYLMLELAALDPRPKGSIIASATVLWSEIDSWPLSALFGSDTGISPNDILNGAIYGVALPISMGDVAVMAFNIWKFCTQKAILGREDTRRPVNILLQEASQFLSTSDHAYVALCREARGNFHISMQSISGGLVTIPEKHLMGILGNCNTQIFTQNNCDQSNQYASALFTEREVIEKSVGGQLDNGLWGLFADEAVINANVNYSKQRKAVCPPETFNFLQRGGGNPPFVEACMRVPSQGMGMAGHHVYFHQDHPLNWGWLDKRRNPDVVWIP